MHSIDKIVMLRYIQKAFKAIKGLKTLISSPPKKHTNKLKLQTTDTTIPLKLYTGLSDCVEVDYKNVAGQLSTNTQLNTFNSIVKHWT